MRAGALDSRIELQRRTLSAPNSTGEKVETFATYATVWAEKLDVRGREFFAAGGTQAELATRFRIRYRTDVVLTDRIVADSRSYNISYIGRIGRKHGLELFAAAAVT